MTPLPDVTRVEIINHVRNLSRWPFGRTVVVWDQCVSVSFELQYQNRTLKIFISDRTDT